MSFREDITCREIVQLVTDYLEGVLPLEQVEGFEMHLAYCGGCVNYLEQLRETIRLSSVQTEKSLPPELEQDLLAAFSGPRR
jgi:predicted anti-sigma-YlaC factor YlaD